MDNEIDLYFNSIKKETPKSTPKSPTTSPTDANDIDSFFSNLQTTPTPTTQAPVNLEPVVPEAPKKSLFSRYMDWSSRTQQKVADIEVDLWNRYKKMGEDIVADETISGIAKSWKDAFTGDTPDGYGGFVAKETVKEMGTMFTEGGKGILDFVTKQIPKTVATLEKGAFESIPLKESGYADKARDFLVSGYNIQIDDITSREKERQEKYADLPITAPQKLGYGVGSGLASIGTSIAIGLVGKSKWGASLVLSALDGSDTYNRARENLIVKKQEEIGRPLTEEEKTTESAKAYGEMLVDTAGIAVLEKVGLDWLLSSRGIWSKAVLETVQESIQTIWSNLVEKYGDNEAKKITDGLAETIIITLPVGAISSGGLHLLDTKLQAQGLSPTESQDLINRIQVRQEEEEKKLKEELDGAVKEENMPEDQKATMDALADDIKENVQNGLSKEQIAIDLAKESGISAIKAFNIINNVTQDGNGELLPVDFTAIAEEVTKEVQQDVSPEEISPTAEIDIGNKIDEIMSGKKTEILNEVKTLIENGRNEGKTELEITQELQKKNNLSLNDAVAEMKKYPKTGKAIVAQKDSNTVKKNDAEIPANGQFVFEHTGKEFTKSKLLKAGFGEEAMGFENNASIANINGIPAVAYNWFDSRTLGGFSVAEQFRGKGVATKYISELLKKLNGVLYVADPNDAMLKVLKKVGDVEVDQGTGTATLTKRKAEEKTVINKEEFTKEQEEVAKALAEKIKQEEITDKKKKLETLDEELAKKEDKALLTPRQGAKKLIESYVLRGDSLKSLKDGQVGASTSEFNASIGGFFNGKKLSSDKIVVNQVNGKKLSSPQVFSLSELYNEIKSGAKEPTSLFETKPKETQQEKVARAVKEKPKTIKEISEETNILEPNVRRILGVGTKEGTFERIDKGVYVLSKDGQDLAWIEAGNSLDVLPRLVSEGKKFDMIYSDLPYESGGNIGGNRPLGYVAFTPEIYAEQVVPNFVSLSRTKDTPIIHIMSTGKSAERAAKQYNDAIINNPNLKLIAVGSYIKLRRSGEVSNMGKYPMPPEAVMIFNQSGELPENLPSNFEVRALDPRYINGKENYKTQKAVELVDKLIEMTTSKGDNILDPFAGSGLMTAQAIRQGRISTAIEIDKNVVDNIIRPRVKTAIKETTKKSGNSLDGWTAGALDTIWTKNTNSPENGYINIFALDDNGENKGTFRVSVETKLDDTWKMVKNTDGTDRLFNSLEEAIQYANTIDSDIRDAETKLVERQKLAKEEANPTKVTTIQGYNDFFKRLQDGKVTPEELQKAHEDFQASKEAIIAELQKKTKAEILKLAPTYYSRASDTKQDMVKRAIDTFNMRFALSQMVSYTGGEGSLEQSVAKIVKDITQKDIDAYVEKVAKSRAEYAERVAKFKKSVTDPTTLEDFKTFIETNGEEKLTQEQRVKYEELVGLKAKEIEAKKIKESGVISGVKADTVMTLSETTHSKTGEPLFKVSMADRIAKDQYIALNTSAKKLGGYYSSFSKGFLFKDKAMAEAFMNVGKGEKIETNRPVEMVAEKKQSVAEKLTDMADRLETAGNDKLNAPRKTNTARRANMASGMEADAQNDIAVAKTMKNLARAIASGEAKLLDRVSTKTQIETLNQLLRSANYKQTRADSKETGTFKTDVPTDLKTVDFVDEFVPTFYIKGLEETVAKSKNTKGLMRSSQKVAESIRKAKAQSKEYYVPSVADMYEIVKINDGLSQNDVDWSTREHVATFKRLQAMGINSIEQLRATLREYIQFKETAVGPDEVKQLERSIIGKKVGVDFFPTPKNIATQMVDMASIEPGMKVLEPSAGNGNIAEVIRDAGVNPDVAEISGDLRAVLEAKGFNVVGNDFMNVTDKYDRIVMNPPFSSNQDIDHLQHAYSLLNEGGKVISIIGEGAFIRQGGKETDFRAWLDDLGASVEELPAGTFKDANLLATTGANARLVEIYKPETTKYKLTAETILNLKRDVNVTDIYGNKSVIPQGEALTPYVLGGSKILLKDGQEYIVNKNQYQNIKNQSVKADAKEFAPELKGIKEIIKDKEGFENDEANGVVKERPKFSQYQVPGGTEYEEALIQAPKSTQVTSAKQATLELEKQGITLETDMDDGVYPVKNGEMIEYDELPKSTQNLLDTAMGNAEDASTFKDVQEGVFKSSHWDEPNILAHSRRKMYRDTQYGDILFSEEGQSDWAREGRDKGFQKEKISFDEYVKLKNLQDPSEMSKYTREIAETGYKEYLNSGVLNNPLLKNWHEMVIKSDLLRAVEKGADYYAWTTGEQQQARYDLSKEIKSIEWQEPVQGEGKLITITPKEGKTINVKTDSLGVILGSNIKEEWVGKKLEEATGKGVSEKILAQSDGELSGEGLKIGGEWAINLYDKERKNIVEELTGGKVEKIKIPTPEEFANIHYEGPTYSLDKLKEALKISQGYKDIFESPFTGEKNKFSFARVSVSATLKNVIKEIENGVPFKDAISNVGSQELAEYMGGEQVVDPLKMVSSEQQALKLTPEIKAIIRSEAPQLKQPSGAEPIESFKVNGVDNVIFDRTKEEIQAGFKKIFGREIPIETVFNAERDLKNIDALAQAFKSGIRLLEVNKNLSEVVANHEGWHWYKMQVSFTERAQITAIEMEYAKQNPEKLVKIKEVYKDQPGYGSEEGFAEELMADTLAEYYETGKTVLEKIQKWFSNALMKLKLLFSGRKDVLDMFKNIKKTLDETTGNTRTFGQKFKIEKHPVFNTGDKLTDARLALEYAEKRTSENGIKARKVPVGKKNIELPQDLTEKIIQIEVLEESIENNPIKELEQYEAKSGVFKGELPEVLGKTKEELKDSKFYNKYKSEKVLKFIKEGDKIVEGINMNYGTNMDSEEARVAYGELKKQQEILKDSKKQVKQEVMDFRNEALDQQALDNLAIQEEKKAITEARKVEMRKLMEETQARLKKEQDIEFRRNQNKNIAKTTAVKELGFWARLVGQPLNPLKYTDKITQNIFSNWNSKLLQGKVRANKEAEAFVEIPASEGMDVINTYEAGKESKYSKDIKTKFDSLLKEARTREVDMGFRENYLPHVYSENATEIKEKIDKYLKEKGMTEAEINLYMNGEKLPDARANLLKINPFFSKERIFPTYKVAMEYGLTPKYKNVAQLVGHYIQELETIIANNELVDELAEAGKILPFEEAPVLVWDMVNLPFAQKGYMAPPATAKVINGLFGKEDPTFWTYTAWLSKKMQEIKLSAGLPYTTVNFFAIGQLVKEITAGNFKAANSFFRANFNRKSIDWMKENRNYVYMMARQGINLRETIDSWDNLYTNISNLDGFAEKSQEVFDRMFSKKTFMSFMPMMQIQLFKDTYNTLLEKGYPAEIAEELAGRVISKNFGLSDFSGRSKATQDKLSATFFAPQFREGIINTLFNAGVAGVDFAKNLGGLRSPLDPTLAKNRKLLVGMMITYFLYNMLNRSLNDDDDDENGGENIWENPENRKFALQIPTDDGTLIYIEFMPSFLAFARNMFSGAVGLGTGDFEKATQKFGTVFSMPIKVVTEVLGNSDYFGRPIYKDTDTGTQKTYAIAKYMGLSITHPYITEIVNQIEDKKPLYQSVIIGLELPLKFSTKDKVAQGAYYDALDAKAKENAQAKKKVQPVYDEVQKLKLEGKIDEATRLYNELSEDQKIIYNKIRISPYESTKIKNDALDVAMTKLSSGNRNINQLEREVATSIYGKDYTPAQLTTATKELAFVRVFGKNDELANDIKSASSNAEKVLLLKKARKEMGEDKFREFFNKGRKTVFLDSGSDSYILISDDLREAYIKQK